MEFSMEISMEFHGIQWNSMEFRGKCHELTERYSPGLVDLLMDLFFSDVSSGT
jgi:hypothetical protein